jgi:hypothetical protein
MKPTWGVPHRAQNNAFGEKKNALYCHGIQRKGSEILTIAT